MSFDSEIKKRRTFAIISHPDAGKTTITEKLLLFGGAISLAGTVKGRKASRHATSDWMELEKERGISVTTSVMQFPYKDCLFNLLDTPGHEDFSEDTYRTLTAVDSALMVIDAVKGVEPRTIKLMEVCRLRDTPIITYVNKLDRDSKNPLDLLDEIEQVLSIECCPRTWPIGMGKHFKGVFDVINNKVIIYQAGRGDVIQEPTILDSLDSDSALDAIGSDLIEEVREEISLVMEAGHIFDRDKFLKGEQTPVYFGSALNNFGVRELMDSFAADAPYPQGRKTHSRNVIPTESKFSGFVFKIQANMDPQHRDRIAFLRVCSGEYTKGKKIYHDRLQKNMQISNALTFLAGNRETVETAYPGDIIGLYNHGTIQVGDTFTEGELLKFIGIPFFAPELFRAVRPKDPLKMKALKKGLTELSEEGATQVFFPLRDNRIILGAVGVLQFDVVAHRLINEYKVECVFENIQVATARWIESKETTKLKDFEQKLALNLALDGAQELTYLAPTMVNLNLTMERWPDIEFKATREV